MKYLQKILAFLSPGVYAILKGNVLGFGVFIFHLFAFYFAIFYVIPSATFLAPSSINSKLLFRFNDFGEFFFAFPGSDFYYSSSIVALIFVCAKNTCPISFSSETD